MKVASIVGARPQFIKAAQISRILRESHEEILIHTGQHYDREMSQVFFDELEIHEPEYNLGVGSGPPGWQTGEMLMRVEETLLKEKPDVTIVYGDTNSTLAGALAAVKIHIPIAHVEAGLRSYNHTMPEEFNRVLTDHISRFLFCPTETAVKNLEKESIVEGVHMVGDVMYDAALRASERAKGTDILERLGVEPKEYILVTIHRAGNTDDRRRLEGIVEGLLRSNTKIIFPAHPRAEKMLREFGLLEKLKKGVDVIKPLSYLEFLGLLMDARKVATDSGGVQKEAYFFGIPCITLRDETEWVETVEDGWNILVGTDPDRIERAIVEFDPKGERGKSYGDGRASEKICRILEQEMEPAPER